MNASCVKSVDINNDQCETLGMNRHGCRLLKAGCRIEILNLFILREFELWK